MLSVAFPFGETKYTETQTYKSCGQLKHIFLNFAIKTHLPKSLFTFAKKAIAVCFQLMLVVCSISTRILSRKN